MFGFFCLEFIVPLENFSLMWRRHHYRRRAAIFYICSALWPQNSEGSLTCHGASVYNGYLRGPVTLTPIAERIAVELSLPLFYDLGLPQLGFENPTFCLWGQRSNPLQHRRGFAPSDFQFQCYISNMLPTPFNFKMTVCRNPCQKHNFFKLTGRTN